jgi:hypothetical protein
MPKVEGFWIVQYAGMEGKDGGVVVLMKGRVWGGDNGFTYIGTYEETTNGAKATVLVENFNPLVGSVLGIKEDHTLLLDVSFVNDKEMVGQGSIASAPPGFGLRVKMTRRAELP